MDNTFDNVKPTEVEEVDIDFSNVNLAQAEESYRQKAEQPKVITREVIKEVPSKISGLGGSVLKNVYTGKQRKVVVCTGDRGTGVTTTALKLATEFSRHCSVLYVDFDVDNHGLLNYIDYTEFRKYEPIHMQGIKLCKNAKAFRSCVVPYDTNLDIITTDYSCDVTPDEIERTQGVIAEIATDYNIVVVDCPVSKLAYITDLVLTGTVALCTEATKRGFMNMLCQFETSELPIRYKRSIVSKGTMLITKLNKNTDLKKLVVAIKSVFEADEVDWMAMTMIPFAGNLNDKLLNQIIEG